MHIHIVLYTLKCIGHTCVQTQYSAQKPLAVTYCALKSAMMCLNNGLGTTPFVATPRRAIDDRMPALAPAPVSRRLNVRACCFSSGTGACGRRFAVSLKAASTPCRRARWSPGPSTDALGIFLPWQTRTRRPSHLLPTIDSTTSARRAASSHPATWLSRDRALSNVEHQDRRLGGSNT